MIVAPAQTISREEAARVAEECVQILIEKFGARRAIPFGSVTGDSPWHSGSDIDLAVEGLEPKLFFKAWAALDDVSPPGVEVDLIDLKDAGPELRALILGEVKMPKDNRAALKIEIENELKDLERVKTKVTEYLGAVSETDEPRQIAIAKFLHDFYNGVESIFERITVRLEGGLPRGDDWHTALLNRTAEALPEVRPAVIDQELHQGLLKFLRFRHRIRHTYSYDLDWLRVKERADELEEVMKKFRAAMERFKANLDQPTQLNSSVPSVDEMERLK